MLQLRDSKKYRELLNIIYPGITINGVPLGSGQRLVYFVNFKNFTRQEPEGEKLMKWLEWGETVVKISNADDASWSARAAQEIAILNDLNSPFFPKFYHYEVLSFNPETEELLTPKLLITIEEKIDGQPLSELLDDFRSEEEVRGLLYKLVSALRVLWEHKKHYVHRDIKPENILIRSDGSLIVIDLGISREAGQPGVTVTSAYYGPCTPEYSSPEQAKNDKSNINYKSDIFSIGTLGYFLLTGVYPFGQRDNETSFEDVIDKVVSFVPDKVAVICPDVSLEFSNIIEKMMEKEPYKRYRKVDTLLSELKGDQ